MRKKYILLIILTFIAIICICIFKQKSPIDSFNQFVLTITNNSNENTSLLQYLGNYVIALFLALLFNSIFIFTDSRIRKVRIKDLIKKYHIDFTINSTNAKFSHTEEKYSPSPDFDYK